MSEPILIVEDEFFIAAEMRSILERNGYEVVGLAADIETAMSKAGPEVALALVDLNLRDGLTGPQIGARLSSEFNTAVLFITANPRLLGEGVAGTIGFISKPADAQCLTSAVEFALERRRGMMKEPPPCLKCFA